MQGWYFQTCELFVLCPACGCIYLKRPFLYMIASIWQRYIYIFAIWEGVTFWLRLGWKTPFWQLSEPCDIFLLMFLAHILLVTVNSSMLSRVLIDYFVQYWISCLSALLHFQALLNFVGEGITECWKSKLDLTLGMLTPLCSLHSHKFSSFWPWFLMAVVSLGCHFTLLDMKSPFFPTDIWFRLIQVCYLR